MENFFSQGIIYRGEMYKTRKNSAKKRFYNKKMLIFNIPP